MKKYSDTAPKSAECRITIHIAHNSIVFICDESMRCSEVFQILSVECPEYKEKFGLKLECSFDKKHDPYDAHNSEIA